jgi:hypothetical protein
MRTQDQFKTLIATLSSDLGKVNDYLTLLGNLAAAQRGAYSRGMSQSPAFWSTVMWALHDAAFHGLARAYDQNDDALTLRTLIEVIDANPSFLSRPEDFDAEQLRSDLAFVRHDTNDAVAHLMLWRHKFLAHRDAGKILRGWTLAEDAPLTTEDVNSLVENGFAILNRYGLAFFNTASARHVHGHDDYTGVLRTLEAGATAQLRRVEEEGARVVATSSSESGTCGTTGTPTAGDLKSRGSDAGVRDRR